MSQPLMNPTGIPEDTGSIPGLTQWVKGSRLSSDPTLLWLWCRPGATAPIRPLAWEPPYATGAALKRPKKKKEKLKKKRKHWGKGIPQSSNKQNLICCTPATIYIAFTLNLQLFTWPLHCTSCYK